LQRYADAGIDTDALARQLQEEGAASFVKSWRQLLDRIEDKTTAIDAGRAGNRA
jgi:transaldolase